MHIVDIAEVIIRYIGQAVHNCVQTDGSTH